VRTRAAVMAAARDLFLSRGYAGTTVADIAAAAGLTKRTVYNNYPDKATLFGQIVADVTRFADAFAHSLADEFATMSSANVNAALEDVGRRLALGIVRNDVVAIRRLLIGESREFPSFAEQYFERAPGQVLKALASGFRRLDRKRVLRIGDASRAAAQFAYLVAGEPLDRAVLVGTIPARQQIVSGAREGVRTFLARYGSGRE
jgi:TetR/AcrR family transcriptional repressor of mexJK operon